MTDQENFKLTEHYSLNDEDIDLIARNSSNPLVKEDWDKSGLSAFKERVRSFLAPRQQDLCAFCRTSMDDGSYYYEIEHIVPKSIHTEWLFNPQNFCLSCRRCNAKKLNNETLVNPHCLDYPQNSEGFNIINPYYDKYSDHIELIENLFYSGKTPKGIKTIELCNLSRYSLILKRIKTLYGHKNRDSYVTLLTLLPNYNKHIDDIDTLVTRIMGIVNNYKFEQE